MFHRCVFLLLLGTVTIIKGVPMALTGNGWMFTSLDASRAYLYTEHAMSWVEAEDFCQMIYGHLATDDSAEYLREYLKLKNISGAVWIGLHQSKPQTQFTWTNDFDWSEVSLSAGDGWGEYVEEYESSLCVSLDIDHGYRWDTRYCQGVMVSGSVCQIELPLWLKDGRCNPVFQAENVTFRYYPDQEVVFWTSGDKPEAKLCSIEDDLTDYQYPSTTEGDRGSSQSLGSSNKTTASLHLKDMFNSVSEKTNSTNKTAEQESGISISIKYEIRNSDRNHGPIFLKDGVPEFHFGTDMTESKTNLSHVSLLDETNFQEPEKENESNNTNTTDEAFITTKSKIEKENRTKLSETLLVKNEANIEYQMVDTSMGNSVEINNVTEKNTEGSNIFSSTSQADNLTSSTDSITSTSKYINTPETEDSKETRATFLSDNVTKVSIESSLPTTKEKEILTSTTPVIELSTLKVNNDSAEEKIEIEEKGNFNTSIFENITISSLVNSPILHRQKRLSSQRRREKVFQSNGRNRNPLQRNYNTRMKEFKK